MSWVIDASVAAKWFFDEDLNSPARALIASDRPLIAPDLILAEVCNAAWKRVVRGEIRAAQALAVASALPQILSATVSAGEILDKAVELALRMRHPVYDCLYLALAELRQLTLVTANDRLCEVTAEKKWPGSIVHLRDVQTQR